MITQIPPAESTGAARAGTHRTCPPHMLVGVLCPQICRVPQELECHSGIIPGISRIFLPSCGRSSPVVTTGPTGAPAHWVERSSWRRVVSNIRWSGQVAGAGGLRCCLETFRSLVRPHACSHRCRALSRLLRCGWTAGAAWHVPDCCPDLQPGGCQSQGRRPWRAACASSRLAPPWEGGA